MKQGPAKRIIATVEEERQGTIRKTVRDVVIGILAGVVIELTLKALDLEGLVPYVPQIWLGIVGFLTLDVLFRRKGIREWSSKFYRSLNWWQKVMSYIAVASIGAATFSAYWFVITGVFKARTVHKEHVDDRHLPDAQIGSDSVRPSQEREHTPTHNAGHKSTPGAKPQIAALSPYSRTESFIVDVPYYGGEDGFPVRPILEEDDYPLNDAYSCLTSVLILYAPANSAPINQIAVLDTGDKRVEALVESLRYCIIEQIVQVERGSSKFGISRTKGSIAEYKPALLPPDSSDYPPEKFLALLSQLPFGNHERIRMLYQGRPLRVPKGSVVELDKLKMDTNDWATHWVFRIEKLNMFNFTVGVAPINAAVGVVPGSFPEQYKAKHAQYVTYSFAITMKINVERTPTNSAEVEDFKDWSEGIWAAIRSKFDIKQQR